MYSSVLIITINLGLSACWSLDDSLINIWFCLVQTGSVLVDKFCISLQCYQPTLCVAFLSCYFVHNTKNQKSDLLMVKHSAYKSKRLQLPLYYFVIIIIHCTHEIQQMYNTHTHTQNTFWNRFPFVISNLPIKKGRTLRRWTFLSIQNHLLLFHTVPQLTWGFCVHTPCNLKIS